MKGYQVIGLESEAGRLFRPFLPNPIAVSGRVREVLEETFLHCRGFLGHPELMLALCLSAAKSCRGYPRVGKPVFFEAKFPSGLGTMTFSLLLEVQFDLVLKGHLVVIRFPDEDGYER